MLLVGNNQFNGFENWEWEFRKKKFVISTTSSAAVYYVCDVKSLNFMTHSANICYNAKQTQDECLSWTK